MHSNAVAIEAVASPAAILRRTAVAAAVAVIATLLFVVPTAPDAGATPATQAEITQSHQLLNQLRASRGLPALRYSGGLSAKAQAWADHMAATGRFEHSTLTEGVPAGWRALAENIAYAASVPAVHNAWHHSPGHLANMVNPTFDNVGIGLARIGSTLYAVHVFGDYLP